MNRNLLAEIETSAYLIRPESRDALAGESPRQLMPQAHSVRAFKCSPPLAFTMVPFLLRMPSHPQGGGSALARWRR